LDLTVGVPPVKLAAKALVPVSVPQKIEPQEKLLLSCFDNDALHLVLRCLLGLKFNLYLKIRITHCLHDPGAMLPDHTS